MKYQTNKIGTVSKQPVDDPLAIDTDGRLSPKPYETPELISYGDVRDITLGGTFGFGESGAGFSIFEME